MPTGVDVKHNHAVPQQDGSKELVINHGKQLKYTSCVADFGPPTMMAQLRMCCSAAVW
jgi:hypothetical protein